ncbi:hypothetical protein EG68_06446 [Paragonimus skrjabini miyazakii]|uniref:Uncharacterized protein n=1 Tax=Paragonimus skrjabini miyazakii TaxID=59628 RepID=A0A8S9YUP6_9TREM|nr:hypothetical protein EG68_06446 [Paragonimus skrjabini miyazakii]
MFEHNHIHVDPGTVITLRIRSFARPGEQTIAYLFRYDEQTRVLDRVSAEQPIEPVQVDADVRMFTERIQLMDNYESRIRKHSAPDLRNAIMRSTRNTLTENGFQLCAPNMYCKKRKHLIVRIGVTHGCMRSDRHTEDHRTTESSQKGSAHFRRFVRTCCLIPSLNVTVQINLTAVD